jgi:hypothetical protein
LQTKGNWWPVWLAMGRQRWNCPSQSRLGGRCCCYSAQVVSAAGGAFSAPHLRVLGNLDRDLRLIPVYREGLRLTLCLLKCCTKPTRIASVIAESSLVTSAHLWWSRTATTLLGSADVLDFNVPHVSSCCQQAKAGSALERRRSTGSGELIWRILDAFGMAVAVPAAAVGAFYWWRPKRVATIPRLRRG